MSEPLRWVREGAVATLTLARPAQRNALGEAMAASFSRAVDEIRADSAVRAVVLCGEGVAFCAGGDLQMLRELAAAPGAASRVRMRAFYRSFLCLLDVEVPVVAAIHGAAVGAGLAITLACDVRIVGEDARVGFNFVRLGIPPGMGSTFLVPRVVGPARAAELLLTGRLVSGREAVAMGLCHEALPAAEVLPRAQAVAAELASAAPIAVRLTKEALRRDLAGLDSALAQEAAMQAIAYPSRDLVEGIAAAIERRPPVFDGK
jgi:enoyl-CoA hydratase/carnithine racemase